MSTTKKLPQQVEIEGTTVPISHPVLQELIGTISEIERSKLYQKIQDQTTTNQNLIQENNTLRGQLTDSTTKLTEAQRLLSIRPDQIVTSQAEQQQNAELSQIRKEEHNKPNLTPDDIRNAVEAALKPFSDKIVKLEQDQIANYKAERLKALGDSVIPELVTGNTVQEIEASITRAVELRKNYAPVASTATTTATNDPNNAAKPPVAPITNPATNPLTPALPNHETGKGERLLDNVASMSMGDFKENREKMLRELKTEEKAYAGQL